jgi:hypothetical protein
MRRREARTVGSERGGRVSRISAKGWPGNRAPAEGILHHGVLAAPRVHVLRQDVGYLLAGVAAVEKVADVLPREHLLLLAAWIATRRTSTRHGRPCGTGPTRAGTNAA